MKRIAIIGSRSRIDRETVDNLVAGLPPDCVIVSGGAAGPDTWAEETARKRGLDVHIFLPDLAGVRGRGEATRRYYARNQQVVDAADEVYALVAENRRGGTEDTIKRARKKGIPVTLLPCPRATQPQPTQDQHSEAP